MPQKARAAARADRPLPLETLETWVQANSGRIAGLDEVGRGCLAGPVVAAAVVLPWRHGIVGLDDSKKLTPAQRRHLYHAIRRQAAAVGIACVSASRIDSINILHASLEAMAAAFGKARGRAAVPLTGALADGPHLAPLPIGVMQHAVVGGDAIWPCIMAASIVAKVVRDRLMQLLAARFPGYGLERHKGYPTPAHRQALQQLGPSSIHRRSFAPVAAVCV
ncbi:MAG: ribonuclease HII [Myxococcota bacterium]